MSYAFAALRTGAGDARHAMTDGDESVLSRHA